MSGPPLLAAHQKTKGLMQRSLNHTPFGILATQTAAVARSLLAKDTAHVSDHHSAVSRRLLRSSSHQGRNVMPGSDELAVNPLHHGLACTAHALSQPVHIGEVLHHGAGRLQQLRLGVPLSHNTQLFSRGRLAVTSAWKTTCLSTQALA